jgi:hypothetical protein
VRRDACARQFERAVTASATRFVVVTGETYAGYARFASNSSRSSAA